MNELHPTFPEDEHTALHSLREGHYWFSHRKRCILERAVECLDGNPRPRVLEFGCGDGDVLEVLADRFEPVVGLERRYVDLRLARRRRNLPVVLAEGAQPPFGSVFDLVGLFDVIEHVLDDTGLLRVAASLVAPGGWILVSVPADPRLWTNLDVYTGHHRRYTRSILADVLRAADLEIVSIEPLFRLLWPIGRAVAAWRGHRIPNEPEKTYRKPRFLNGMLLAALRTEHALMRRVDAGIGTSWLAAARKPIHSAS